MRLEWTLPALLALGVGGCEREQVEDPAESHITRTTEELVEEDEAIFFDDQETLVVKPGERAAGPPPVTTEGAGEVEAAGDNRETVLLALSPAARQRCGAATLPAPQTDLEAGESMAPALTSLARCLRTGPLKGETLALVVPPSRHGYAQARRVLSALGQLGVPTDQVRLVHPESEEAGEASYRLEVRVPRWAQPSG